MLLQIGILNHICPPRDNLTYLTERVMARTESTSRYDSRVDGNREATLDMNLPPNSSLQSLSPHVQGIVCMSSNSYFSVSGITNTVHQIFPGTNSHEGWKN